MSFLGVVPDFPLLLIPDLNSLLAERGELRPRTYPPVQRSEPLGVRKIGRGVKLPVPHPEIHLMHLRPLGVDVRAVEDAPVAVAPHLHPLEHHLQPLPSHDHAVGVELQDDALDVPSLLRDGIDARPAGKREHRDERRLFGERRRLGGHFAEPAEELLRIVEPSLLLRGEHSPRTERDALRHSAIGYLRESSREGGDKRAVSAQCHSSAHGLLPAARLPQREERSIEGVGVVRLAVAHHVGAVLLRVLLQLALEKGREDLRLGLLIAQREHLVQAAPEPAANPVGCVRGSRDVAAHPLREPPQVTLERLLVRGEVRLEGRVCAANHDRSAERFSEVLSVESGEVTLAKGRSQEGVREMAGGGPVRPLPVGLRIHHAVLLEEGEEDAVDVGDVLFTVRGADYLPGYEPKHRILFWCLRPADPFRRLGLGLRLLIGRLGGRLLLRSGGT